MSPPILATKLFIPPLRPNVITRPRLIAQLNAGLHRKLTLISAAAGFGKTTLLSEWIIQKEKDVRQKAESDDLHPSNVAWLSLDENDSDRSRFLTYCVAALQTLAPNIGNGVLGALQSPQPPPIETLLAALINDIATIQQPFILILDDYHLVDSPPIDHALTFLIEHQPPQMHLVVATREDPALPLARLRARAQMTELRAADLRFAPAEAADFLNEAMGLQLTMDDVAALEGRTEGWIAGLQLAALALQGSVAADSAEFIASFTGSHRFVLDYLVAEVLNQQPEPIQRFLLDTSILDRLCGPLCDAVLGTAAGTGQETLAHLDQTNLFTIRLDDERRWYRYHHLFGDLLRQRLTRRLAKRETDVLHQRASAWFEAHGFDVEAFHHAVLADDIERAVRLVEGGWMPLHFRGAVLPVLNWLTSLPSSVLDEWPSLWVLYASALLFIGRIAAVESKLQSAENALQNAEQNAKNRDLIGHIASIRATVAITQFDAPTILAESQRALAHLHPDNLPVRTATIWTMGVANNIQGDRAAARQAFSQALSISEAIGHLIITIGAKLGLAQIQQVDTQLRAAEHTFHEVLQLAGDPPWPIASEAHLGLAQIYCEWNELDSAETHARQSIELAHQLENTDRSIAGALCLARIKLAQTDISAAAALATQAEHSARQRSFSHLLADIAAVRVSILLRQGDLDSAENLAQQFNLPLSHAQVQLERNDPAAARAILEPLRQEMASRNWRDELLKTSILEALARDASGDSDKAQHSLSTALELGEPGGYIRSFLDADQPLAELLQRMKAQGGRQSEYANTLLAAFDRRPSSPTLPPLVEPLSRRELEILQLVAQGLSNKAIGERLFLALSTVKGHNRNIYGKLQVQRRTEAVARARELGLI